MFSIENPTILFFIPLCFLPPLAFVLYKRWSARQRAKMGIPANVGRQLVGFSLSVKRREVWLMSVVVVLMVLALANFRMGSGKEVKERKGLDIIIALDVSKSMTAKDIQPDRLSRSKSAIQMLLRQLNGDRVGLILFAGNAYLQCPVTTDYNALRMMLETASPTSVPRQGTALGEAIDLARTSFFSDLNKYKVVVLITDGESHDNEALPMAAKAHREGVVIYTVGVGSPEGALLTDPVTGAPKLDPSGNQVVSKLNEQILKDISQAAQGEYFYLNNPTKVADALVKKINGLEKRNQASVVFSRYNSYYQWFLLPAIILLLLSQFIPKKQPKLSAENE